MQHQSGDTSSKNSKPNALVFFTDQQRWDCMGVHGNPLGLTPNFDRLCSSGVHLENHFTCQPVCGPARACIQTGLYATQNGSYNNSIPLNRDLPTLAKLFSAGGYDTAYIGKWHLSDAGRGAVPQEDRGGYSFWLAANIIELVTGPYSTLVYDEENQPIKLPGYRVDALTDAANRYLAAPRKNPFFLFFSLLEPHQQNDTDDYPAPDGYEEMYSNRWMPPDLQALGGSAPEHIGGYYGMVKRIDEAFGRILDVLKSTGQLDNTIILFTSDHGNHFKTRNDKYKRSVHESSIRIPGLLHGPGLAQGKRLTSLSSLIDLPATLLAAAGLPVPEHFAGRSLLPEINGEKKIASDDDYVIIQVSGSQHGRVIRTQRWKYAFTAPWEDAPQPQSYTESHLYDLENDPCELNNLIHCPEHQDIIAALREKLLNKLTEIGEPPIPIHTVFSEAEAERSI